MLVTIQFSLLMEHSGIIMGCSSKILWCSKNLSFPFQFFSTLRIMTHHIAKLVCYLNSSCYHGTAAVVNRSFSTLYPSEHFAPMCSRNFAPCLQKVKNSLQGILDTSCAYGEDQAGRNEENYGFAFPSILTSTVVSQHQKQCIVSHNRCSVYVSHKVGKTRREQESANPF